MGASSGEHATGSAQAQRLAGGGGGGGGSRAGWAKAEQVLGQRMERVATAWLEAIDQVRARAVFPPTTCVTLGSGLPCCA